MSVQLAHVIRVWRPWLMVGRAVATIVMSIDAMNSVTPVTTKMALGRTSGRAGGAGLAPAAGGDAPTATGETSTDTSVA